MCILNISRYVNVYSKWFTSQWMLARVIFACHSLPLPFKMFNFSYLHGCIKSRISIVFTCEHLIEAPSATLCLFAYSSFVAWRGGGEGPTPSVRPPFCRMTHHHTTISHRIGRSNMGCFVANAIPRLAY